MDKLPLDVSGLREVPSLHIAHPPAPASSPSLRRLVVERPVPDGVRGVEGARFCMELWPLWTR